MDRYCLEVPEIPSDNTIVIALYIVKPNCNEMICELVKGGLNPDLSTWKDRIEQLAITVDIDKDIQNLESHE